jgi:serine/threonine-protein kinase
VAHPWESKWTVGDRLGKGGQGITHAVSHIDDPSIRGALKRLKNNRDSQARGRMRGEVANLQRLASAGGSVPRVLTDNAEAFEDLSTELYVVMDLIVGSTIRAYVEENGTIDIDTAIAIVLALCKSAAIAHSIPVLHRDLNPENIIFRREDLTDPVIIDFGLSFNADDKPMSKPNESFRSWFLALPETNTPLGDRRDHRSDLTALCALLYYCLTGHGVGQLKDESEKLPHFHDGRSLHDSIPNDARIVQVEAFLTKGLSQNIANRYQDVAEIVGCLTPIVEASKEIDESDPFQVARALSDEMRLTDRKIQIAEFTQQAIILFNFSQQTEFPKYHKGRFANCATYASTSQNSP